MVVVNKVGGGGAVAMDQDAQPFEGEPGHLQPGLDRQLAERFEEEGDALAAYLSWHARSRAVRSASRSSARPERPKTRTSAACRTRNTRAPRAPAARSAA